MQSKEFPLFLNLVQTYDLRPSEVMGIEDTYIAYCFDQAILEYFLRIEKGEKPIMEKPKKKKIRNSMKENTGMIMLMNLQNN